MALSKISTLRCLIFCDTMFFMPESLLLSTVERIKLSCWTWEGPPMPTFSSILQPAALNSCPGKEIGLLFWVTGCDSHISSSEFPGTGFSISMDGYNFPSSEPGWWVLWVPEKLLGLSHHQSAVGLERSSTMSSRHLGSVLFSRKVGLGIGKAPQLFLRIPLKFLIMHTNYLELLGMSEQSSQIPSPHGHCICVSEYWVSLLMNQYIFIVRFLMHTPPF